ncbi:MAG: beta-carotene hydroxylase [Fibrobacteres bacterium]|nr:beta-carotene hydroxylase [Fibrobacterota bacterium]
MLAGILLGFPLMELVAWASHRWIMHGPLWILHRSHHGDGGRRWEANDLFGLFFSAVSIGLIGTGVSVPGTRPFRLGLGLGMAAYGLAYLVFHDVLAHARFGRRGVPRIRYVRRLLRAHRIHHSRDERDGSRHFGFLWAPPAGAQARSGEDA